MGPIPARGATGDSPYFFLPRTDLHKSHSQGFVVLGIALVYIILK